MLDTCTSTTLLRGGASTSILVAVTDARDGRSMAGLGAVGSRRVVGERGVGMGAGAELQAHLPCVVCKASYLDCIVLRSCLWLSTSSLKLHIVSLSSRACKLSVLISFWFSCSSEVSSLIFEMATLSLEYAVLSARRRRQLVDSEAVAART